MKNNNQAVLKKILKKKAVGFDVVETVEEYVVGKDDDSLTLAKRKVTKKSIPPDISAVKLLLGIDEEKGINFFGNMSDEELLLEKERLLTLLSDMQINN